MCVRAHFCLPNTFCMFWDFCSSAWRPLGLWHNWKSSSTYPVSFLDSLWERRGITHLSSQESHLWAFPVNETCVHCFPHGILQLDPRTIAMNVLCFPPCSLNTEVFRSLPGHVCVLTPYRHPNNHSPLPHCVPIFQKGKALFADDSCCPHLQVSCISWWPPSPVKSTSLGRDGVLMFDAYSRRDLFTV